ncbi:Uncharacterized protein HZ326_1579 [Fusarium oxysporum f. sp. albedinis]|nr:Uncharacterized protein HZ326_1579 [Fusarium oxysporum f. sp. albedinis]
MRNQASYSLECILGPQCLPSNPFRYPKSFCLGSVFRVCHFLQKHSDYSSYRLLTTDTYVPSISINTCIYSSIYTKPRSDQQIKAE